MKAERIKSTDYLSFRPTHTVKEIMTSAVKVLNNSNFFGGYVEVEDRDGKPELKLETTTYQEVTKEEQEDRLTELILQIYKDIDDFKKERAKVM